MFGGFLRIDAHFTTTSDTTQTPTTRSRCQVSHNMSQFSTRRWAALLAGGDEALSRKAQVLQQFHDALREAEPRPVQREHLTRQQQYLRALHVWRVLQECRARFAWSDSDYHTAVSAGGESGPFIVHDMMFVGTLRALCSQWQWQQWGEPAAAGAITGCYSQTELSHGSDVSSLSTVAVFEPANDSLTLHTPSLGATKWWSGGQGNAAQFAIVFAQLCVPVRPPSHAAEHSPAQWQGVTSAAAAAACCSASGDAPTSVANAAAPVVQSLGVVPIFVQIRDVSSHQPLPGVTVGDLGAKFGFGEVDNGYMQLNAVNVPASHILGKVGTLECVPHASPGQPVARLTPSGGGAKAAYAGMLFERVAMVAATVHTLAVACTVATRYSLTRRQFRDSAVKRPRRLLFRQTRQAPRSTAEGVTPAAAALHLTPVDLTGAPLTAHPEELVMHYQTQHTRVCTAIALAHATHAVADFLGASHQQLTCMLSGAQADSTSDADKASAISALHGLASGVKAVLSEVASAAIESCRRCCGGHGYMQAGGLAGVFAAYVHVATAGGDTYVLTQQAYKLLTGAHLGMGPREGGQYACHTQLYLSQPFVSTASARRSDLQHASMKSAHDTTLGGAIHVNGPLWLSHPVALVLALRRVAVRCTSEVGSTISQLMEGGTAAAGLGDSTPPLSFTQACAAVQVMGLDAVWAHVMSVMMEVAMRRTAQVLLHALPVHGPAAPHSDQWWAHLQFLGQDAAVGALSVPAAVEASPVVQAATQSAPHQALTPHDALVATRTLMVFGLHCMLSLAPAAMRTGVVAPAEAGQCRTAWTTLCSALVPDALPLLDALALPDRSLPGYLGRGIQHSFPELRDPAAGAHVPTGAEHGTPNPGAVSGNDDIVYAALLSSAVAAPLNSQRHQQAAGQLVGSITLAGGAVATGGGGAEAKL